MRIARSVAMRSHTAKLADQLVIVYEMDGHAGVERYAREHGIPLGVCRRIVANYAVSQGLRALAAGR